MAGKGQGQHGGKDKADHQGHPDGGKKGKALQRRPGEDRGAAEPDGSQQRKGNGRHGRSALPRESLVSPLLRRQRRQKGQS